MKQGLSLRVSQHLALTPQLQQSIRLLQLSTLELAQEVEQMLDDNPFLETAPDEAPREEFGLAQADAPAFDGEGDTEGSEFIGSLGSVSSTPAENSEAPAAPVDDVMRAWAGLGYYARARNLLACARAVARDHGGVFPATRDGLLTLPGIGPYTASAIAAIAHDEAATVVDGNVERVMARAFLVETPLPAAKVHRVLDAQLGTKWRDRFTSFDDTPVASASIGQVHKGVWRDGREVAVKEIGQAKDGQSAIKTRMRDLVLELRILVQIKHPNLNVPGT